jgi:hypothetical protein
MNQKMLVSQKQAQHFKSIISTNELHDIFLEGIDTSDVDFGLDDLVEVSDKSIEIDEMEIDKLYMCL